MSSLDLPDTVWERRCGDRRRRAAFRLKERRSGFDRRLRLEPGARRTYGSFLWRLKEDAVLLLVLLAAINVLNLLDFGLTLMVLSRGGAEANPVLKPLFSVSPLAVAAFKLAVVGLVSALIWKGRRFRPFLQAALLILLLFAGVVGYQIGGLVLL